MAKKWNKALAFALALCMCAGSMNVTAWATTETVTDTVDNADGTTTTITTTTDRDTDSEGNLTVTVTVEKATDGTTQDGVKIDRDEKRVDTTVTDENGEVIQESWKEGGTETKEWTEADDGSEAGQPEVTVPLEPGKPTAETETTTETTGNINSENGQTTTTITDRTVTATTSEVTTKVNDVDTGLVEDQITDLNGIDPVYDEDDNVVHRSDGLIHDGYGKDGMFDRNYLSTDSKYTNIENWDMPVGADLRYVGTGEHCVYYNARVTVIYEKDGDGNTKFDENGNPIIKSITKSDGTPITIDGVLTDEIIDEISLKPVYDDYNGARPLTFMLMDNDGNKVYGYCCDMGIDAKKGKWYSIANLEDSDYYASKESEEHIRTIVMNGYWGTSDVQNKDGSYNMGSLESIKENLKDAINSNKMANEEIQVPTVDAEGNPVLDDEGNPVMESKTMLELIDDLTEGEALLATQSAIWSYSNGSIAAQSGKDGLIVVDPDGYKWNHDPAAVSKTWTDESTGESFDLGTLDDFGSARVDFLYKWLINLETEEKSTVVINEKNFVDDLQMTVKDKVSDHANNQDENQNNDVYNTELNFTLKFEPSRDKDDLLVYISYGEGDNKQTIVKRLAGKDKEGQNYGEAIEPVNGVYTIEGLTFAENSNVKFDLRLEGTQYLEQGVYLYSAVGGRTESQTMVGIAEGTRNVDVSANVTINFNVDENNYVKTEHKWYDESDPVRKPVEDPEYPEYDPEEQDDDKDIPEDPVPMSDLVDIFDEEIPLANVPQTGANNTPWSALAAIAGLAMAVATLGKKNK